ncbi:hypothetical protein PtrSN002B_004233 [Pyrenophora tritici-repentis]|uniref:Uncharacterized protein n=2 Tax=Pyrenophora tritici-repentis TaxID=45151 RepID=A0A2W1DYB2_9PLEO|nr:uncharacterized protein PTRG_04021 [Pyrenophora tritici-repentis Pt-1C-BFP]KAA8619907.1 hypothetical protein PtrV1_07001 [Pyrenophora tritici-repentis]EDU46859.1 predicted protein [Pyrenophora tritici-repentis Pt-1C-BFP]KAF7448049.1 hypothetical protein A1F99_074130 [Pyrenophora tritici-repentis]KAG9385036.1 hypothetical protein A1F94_004583 [Pyrenophora tritici-repentis]KAI0575686.1 hypothetical protein Alg215_07868 [Pyrenophora tritici-repentis]
MERARLLRAAGKLTNAGGQEVSRRQTKGRAAANCNATGEADSLTIAVSERARALIESLRSASASLDNANANASTARDASLRSSANKA